jgi:hypothetical protein
MRKTQGHATPAPFVPLGAPELNARLSLGRLQSDINAHSRAEEIAAVRFDLGWRLAVLLAALCLVAIGAAGRPGPFTALPPVAINGVWFAAVWMGLGRHWEISREMMNIWKTPAAAGVLILLLAGIVLLPPGPLHKLCYFGLQFAIAGLLVVGCLRLLNDVPQAVHVRQLFRFTDSLPRAARRKLERRMSRDLDAVNGS